MAFLPVVQALSVDLALELENATAKNPPVELEEMVPIHVVEQEVEQEILNESPSFFLQ